MTFQIENINENIKIIKKKKIENPYLKSVITEILNSLRQAQQQIQDIRGRVSKLEDRPTKITHPEEQKGK